MKKAIGRRWCRGSSARLRRWRCSSSRRWLGGFGRTTSRLGRAAWCLLRGNWRRTWHEVVSFDFPSFNLSRSWRKASVLLPVMPLLLPQPNHTPDYNPDNHSDDHKRQQRQPQPTPSPRNLPHIPQSLPPLPSLNLLRLRQHIRRR